MRIEVVHLPKDLKERHLTGRTVVVFDVLRATTTMITALGNGANQVRIFPTLSEASNAARSFDGPKLLCGERRCVRPEGFDLGNSPREFSARKVRGKTLFMCTTNGTKAILAARGADELLVASLINATATARYLNKCARDVTMLCAGTNGKYAFEDQIGAGAVIAAVKRFDRSKVAQKSVDLFRLVRKGIAVAFRGAPGGQNVMAAGLGADLDFAAQVDVYDLVARVKLHPLRVVRV